VSGPPDALVVGSGPNGLAAALTLARAGVSVEVREGAATLGGGCRTEALTLPGFTHDVCSTVHPLLAASPFFRRAELALELLTPQVAFAHPLDGGEAAALSGSVAQTAATLGADGRRYERALGPLVEHIEQILPTVLGPLLRPPRHPLALARFGLLGLAPAQALASALRTPHARALLAGLAAHSMRPLSAPGTGAFALLLGLLAHGVGWPVIAGGSARITEALAEELIHAGAVLRTDSPVSDLSELSDARLKLLDVTPRALSAIAGERLAGRQRRSLERFRYGPGACKVDWALSGPVPWTAEICRQTPTLHLGGRFEEIAHGEAEVAAGRHPERPFCIAVQPSVIDPSRAPAGQHSFYAYCHVPAGSDVDMTERIEAQVERFAPGFRDLILARTSMTAVQLERRNPNYVGGDINSGAATLLQTILRHPTPSLRPYNTPLPGVFLCSSSTPPGGGVHGMCGEWGARAALRELDLN
jgi:phytoene dehydrogenase-like protein